MALRQISARKRSQNLRKSDDRFVENEDKLPYYLRLRRETDRIGDYASSTLAKVEAMAASINASYEAVKKESELIEIKEYHQATVKQCKCPQSFTFFTIHSPSFRVYVIFNSLSY